MFTDFYLTNVSTSLKDNTIVFFQKTTDQLQSKITSFTNVKNCPYRWLHKVRIFWNLSFRLIYTSKNITSVYHLKTVYTKQRKAFLIAKEGIVSVQQYYKNGKQVIDFEQVKGAAYIGVQIYRGDFLIEESYFKKKNLTSRIGTNINIALYRGDCMFESIDMQELEAIAVVDYTSVKSVDIKLMSDQYSYNSLQIDGKENW